MTFRNVLLQYFDEESELIEIEQQLLPENSFSAESWDPNDPEQNPVVAVRLSSSSDVPMIDNFHNQEYVVESDLIPAYPVIVIKDNERIELSDGSSKSTQKISLIKCLINPTNQLVTTIHWMPIMIGITISGIEHHGLMDFLR